MWTGLVTTQHIKSWLRGNVTGLFPLRWVLTCNVTAYRNVASDSHGTELRAELPTRASRRNSILRALHRGVPSLLREPSDVFAASSGFVRLYTFRFKGKEKRADGGDVSRCTSTPAQAVTVPSL